MTNPAASDFLPRLAAIEVRDTEDRPVRLGDAWAERPVVLSFVRHFGWMFCREEVAQLRDALPEIEERGARLVVVGNGTAAQARDFKEERGLSFEVYTDPGLESYRAAGFGRKLRSSMSPRVALNGLRALRAGARQGRVQGDPWQQGGLLVVAPPGVLLYRYANAVGGDHAPLPEVLAALEGERAGS